MIKPLRAFGLVPFTALCLVSAAVQAQPSPAPGASASMAQGHMQQSNIGSEEMKQAMMTGMDNMQKMPITGDIDKDFAMMMKMHHQQALDMAEMQLAHGNSPELKAMASKIILGQKKEIAQFDRWLAKQK